MKLRLGNASVVLRALLVAACLLHTIPVQADVTLPKVFSAHAVLQRDLPLPVWGTAEPGENVMVKLGDDLTDTERYEIIEYLKKL